MNVGVMEWRNLSVGCVVVAWALSGTAANPRWDELRGGLARPVFHPTAQDGIYDPGAPVELVFSCEVTNGLTGGVRAGIDLREFRGATVSNVLTSAFAAENPKTMFKLTAPKRYGHYTLVMRLVNAGGSLGTAETAFVVAPPSSDGRDPYFVIDKNCWEPGLMESMKRFGFGGSCTAVTSASQALAMSEAEREAFYESLKPAKRTKGLAVKGFEISGGFSPHLIGGDAKVFARANERVSKGLPPLTDDDFARIREHGRRTAAALKDIVTDWFSQEEFDCFDSIMRDGIAENRLVWSLLSAQIQKNIHLGLKEGNPRCRHHVLGPCCGDYFWNKEKFGLTKLLLSTLKGHFDCLALDAYSGNWNGGAGKLTPPEDALARMLRDAAAVSVACGGPNKVANAERCAAVDYFSAFDGPVTADQADYTSRSMIINRSVAECTCYTLHILAGRWFAAEVKADPTKRNVVDLGIWQALVRDDGEMTFVPRPAVMTAGVAARKLAFAENPKSFELEHELHAASFDTGKDRALLVVWTTGSDVKVRLAIPEGTVLTDVGGNDIPCEGRSIELLVSTSPVYLTAPRSGRAALEKALGEMPIVWRSPEAAKRFVEVGGKMPDKPTFVISAPDSVYPQMAVMPEYGFFGRKIFGRVDTDSPWPYAEVRFAWKTAGLAAEIRIFNKPYVAGKDKVRLRLLASDGLPLFGTEVYERLPVILEAKNVSGDEKGSVWRFTMPWSALKGMKPEAGAHVACNVICDCVPIGRTDRVRYALANDEPETHNENFRNKCVMLELK